MVNWKDPEANLRLVAAIYAGNPSIKVGIFTTIPRDLTEEKHRSHYYSISRLIWPTPLLPMAAGRPLVQSKTSWENAANWQSS